MQQKTMPQIKRGLLWAAVAVVALVAFNALTSLVPDVEGSSQPDHTSTSEADDAPGDTAIDDQPDSPTPAGSDTPANEGATGNDGATDNAESGSDAENLTARQMLQSIPVKGRAPKTGYDREGQFGPAWFDTDANGCDTRNDLLRRDLDGLESEDGCTVLSGTLTDPFSSDIINFQRGETTSILVQIDHVVALSNAWQTGAAQLSEETRLEFANDPLNLIAVSGRLNAQKGDGDAATWLPPNRDFWCEYVARQVGVKAHYDLWVTPAEFERMDSILADCDNPPALSPAAHQMFRPGSLPGF